ncbi:MAG: orotidine-5'-phosphate decarboxylase [Planctomycetota bacterium]
MSWAERFGSRGSALCIGLDPDPARIPDGMDVPAFLRAVVDLTAEYAACFKPNVAFFERLGPAGLADLAQLIADLRARGLPVIADGKRGDVGPTAEAYAAAYFGGPFGVDALTVSPFLGLDTLAPFREAAVAQDAGVFVLLRTSNVRRRRGRHGSGNGGSPPGGSSGYPVPRSRLRCAGRGGHRAVFCAGPGCDRELVAGHPLRR